MDKYIALFDLSKNEVGRLNIEDNNFVIHIVSKYSQLEGTLKAIGENLQGRDSFTLKRAVNDNGTIVQFLESVKSGDERYINAVASYINNQIRTTPRIIAVVKASQEVR